MRRLSRSHKHRRRSRYRASRARDTDFERKLYAYRVAEERSRSKLKPLRPKNATTGCLLRCFKLEIERERETARSLFARTQNRLRRQQQQQPASQPADCDQLAREPIFDYLRCGLVNFVASTNKQTTELVRAPLLATLRRLWRANQLCRSAVCASESRRASIKTHTHTHWLDAAVGATRLT